MKGFIFFLLFSVVTAISYNPACVNPNLEYRCIEAKCSCSTSKSCLARATAYIGSNQCCDEEMIQKLTRSCSKGPSTPPLRYTPSTPAGRGRKRRQVYNFDKYPASKWTLPIKYYYNSSVDASLRTTIDRALRYIEQQTCVKYTEISSPPPEPNNFYMSFNIDQECVSFVGKSSEQNSPILGTQECFSKFGTVLYLLTQSLGMWHATQRPDSQQFVTINASNINPINAVDFTPIITNDLLTLGLPYDMASIMTFPPKVFSINDKVTINTIDPAFKNTIGQKVEYSHQDAKVINSLYCNDVCPLKLSCTNGGYTDPKNCNICRCPDAFTGTLCDVIATPTVTLATTADCGSELVAKYAEKFVTSPGYVSPGYYPSDATCLWHIKGDDLSRIRMRFVDEFGIYIDPLYACQHWVEVKYKTPLNNTAARFCDYSRPTAMMYANSNDVIVSFKSKWSDIPSTQRRGFKLAYLLVCSNESCQNGGVCSSDSCQCQPGFSGVQCEEGPNIVTTPTALCQPNPCKNNGTCVPLSGGSYMCQCQTKFYGKNCENANCGGCNSAGGVKQAKCCNTQQQSTCQKLVLVYSCDYRGCGPKYQYQKYPCKNNSVCCDNAFEKNNYCYATGWSPKSACSKTCGNGTSTQTRYDIVVQNGIRDYQAVETKVTSCNTFACVSRPCSSSSSSDDDDHHHFLH